MTQLPEPEDRRAPPPPKISTTAAYGLTAVLGLATAHWIMKCIQAGHVVPPDDALLEMWVGAVLPTAHLIGKIINHHLEKLAGEDK